MTTITNNKLTDEEITALALKLFDGSSFYFQSGRRPGAKTMAELLNKAASAVAELQERRKADEMMVAVCEVCGRPCNNPNHPQKAVRASEAYKAR
ncbi:hypothetical protein AIT70_001071 [Salmonella enterica subsp. arizonae]|nr:Eaa protein [Salmonella enterica subsp. arizonae]